MTVTDAYGTDVRTATVGYLDAVCNCIELLPVTIEQYGDPSFEETAALLCEHEPTADEHLQELRTVLSDTVPPNYTDVYFRTDEVMRLFALIDAVPNVAEDFIHDLETIQPMLPGPVIDDFAEIATVTVTATDHLADVTEAYIAELVTEGQTDNYTDGIEAIAALEGQADARRQAVVERVFDDGATPGALLVRDLAQSLDSAPDAAEDAADHLLFMQGATV